MPAVTPKRTARKKAAAPAPETAPEAAPVARKTAAKKAPAKKAPAAAAKAPAKKVATKKMAPAPAPVAAKRTAKKVTTKAVAKKAPAKTAALKDSKTVRTVALDPFGFVEGSDSSIAAHALVEGGTSRTDINDKVKARLEKTTTRSGNEKVVSTIVGNVFGKLKKDGYTVESSWKLEPPAEVKKVVAAKKRVAARKK